MLYYQADNIQLTKRCNQINLRNYTDKRIFKLACIVTETLNYSGYTYPFL